LRRESSIAAFQEFVTSQRPRYLIFSRIELAQLMKPGCRS